MPKSRVEIVEKEFVRLKNPTIIEGFPSVGLVGAIATEYIAGELRMKEIGFITSRFLPPVILVKDGVWYERFVAMEELLKGKSMTHRMLYDLSTALNYLTSRKDVDSERIGCVGHSMGGMQTLYLAAIDERIKAAVISGALSTFESIIKNQINHCFFPYLPGLLEKGIDMGDILGMIAPRPVLVISAKYDEWMPIKGAKEAYQKAKKIYGNNELEMLVTEGKHGFDRDVWNKAYSWISSKLI